MEPVKSNLEPISEDDLNLEKHLKKDNVLSSGNETEQVSAAVEKEAPKETVAAEHDGAYNNILSKIKTQQQSLGTAAVKQDADEVANKTDAEAQVQHLVDIAINKGIVHAVDVAKHLENNYVLDTFHDKMMADELHDALVKKGMLKEL